MSLQLNILLKGVEPSIDPNYPVDCDLSESRFKNN